jgi:hypothetical protein
VEVGTVVVCDPKIVELLKDVHGALDVLDEAMDEHDADEANSQKQIVHRKTVKIDKHIVKEIGYMQLY